MSSIVAKTVGGVVALTLIAGLGVWLRPPDLVRVSANYAAKTVCSNVFLAGRDPEDVLHTDVQAPGHPLLRLLEVRVDREHGVIRAGLFGFIGNGMAVFRSGAGCAVSADGRLGDLATAHPPRGPAAPGPAPANAVWPDGDTVRTDPSIQRVLDNETLVGRGLRAIVVVYGGRIVGERYAGGFLPQTPQLGWSMTKTVLAGMIGVLVKEGRLALDQSAGWSAPDPRGGIRVADLLSMSSGLRFDEGYAAVSDVTRMLYLEPDMAQFARAQPLVNPVGAVWSYASGSAVILARMVQDAAPDAAAPNDAALARRLLFAPLGMSSAVFETDEHGTLVGSSYLYATPRDWARYGQLLVQAGVWRGVPLLPAGYVAMMAAPLAASQGEYGHGLVWRRVPPRVRRVLPDATGADSDDSLGIPADAFWMAGHDGQYIGIIPSRGLVVVRMGLTPTQENYRPEPLVQALLEARQAGAPPGFTPASSVSDENQQ